MEERVSKILAHAGIAARRKAEQLIRAGRVQVNGQIVREPGAKADPEKDTIRLDGERVGQKKRRHHYIILHKPLQMMTTMKDEEGRPCVGDLLEKTDVRLYPAGRLDWDSEGLLILTDDGEFANHIMHPRYEVPKTYLAKVEGKPTLQALEKLRRGVILDDGPTLPAKVEVVRRGEQHDWLQITITEGRNRIVRRMCERVRFPVIKLKRVGIGPLRLGNLPPGSWRPFTAEEMQFVSDLKAGRPVSGLPAGRPEKPPRGEGFARAKPPRVQPGYKKRHRVSNERERARSKERRRRAP